MSWIAVQDWVEAVLHILKGNLSGALNLSAPSPVRNADFTSALGRALKKPTAIPVPAFALKTLYGREMAEETVLSSCKVVPQALQADGFVFQYPNIDDALSALL